MNDSNFYIKGEKERLATATTTAICFWSESKSYSHLTDGLSSRFYVVDNELHHKKRLFFCFLD
jgi:hypothetical protein